MSGITTTRLLSFNMFFSRSESKPVSTNYGRESGYMSRLPFILEWIQKNKECGFINLQELMNKSNALEQLHKALGNCYHITNTPYNSRNKSCQLATLVSKNLVKGKDDVIKWTYEDLTDPIVVDTVLMTYIVSLKVLLINVHVGTSASIRKKLAKEGLSSAVKYAQEEAGKKNWKISQILVSGDFNAFSDPKYRREEYLRDLTEAVKINNKVTVPSEKATSVFYGGKIAPRTFFPAPTDFLDRGVYEFAKSYELTEDEIREGILPVIEDSMRKNNKPLSTKYNKLIEQLASSDDKAAVRNITKLLTNFDVEKMGKELSESDVYDKLNKDNDFTEFFGAIESGKIKDQKKFFNAFKIYSVILFTTIVLSNECDLDLILAENVSCKDARVHDKEIYISGEKFFPSSHKRDKQVERAAFMRKTFPQNQTVEFHNDNFPCSDHYPISCSVEITNPEKTQFDL